MPSSNKRFEAQTFTRLMTVNQARRFEMQFCDSDGHNIVVSLPVDKAVELGCRICDISERAPYLVGGVQTTRDKGSRAR
jgi:hypothetical protein